MATQTTELPAVAASKETPLLEADHTVSALAAAGDFLRGFWPRLVAISAAVLAPCFWHPRIEAGDLPSHTYNAWLAHLISTGQIPGLVLARQWNNVLFDLMLSGLGNLLGLGAARRSPPPSLYSSSSGELSRSLRLRATFERKANPLVRSSLRGHFRLRLYLRDGLHELLPFHRLSFFALALVSRRPWLRKSLSLFWLR